MGASISANHGSHYFINSKGRDNPPTHNSNSIASHRSNRNTDASE